MTDSGDPDWAVVDAWLNREADPATHPIEEDPMPSPDVSPPTIPTAPLP